MYNSLQEFSVRTITISGSPQDQRLDHAVSLGGTLRMNQITGRIPELKNAITTS